MSKGRGEDRVSDWLRRSLLRAEQNSTVRLVLHPQHADPTNRCPDFVVEAEVRVPLFPHHAVRVRVPLLIEVEAGMGFEGAREDLEKYLVRTVRAVESGVSAAPITLVFVVATEADAGQHAEVDAMLPVRFEAVEVPIPEEE